MRKGERSEAAEKRRLGCCVFPAPRRMLISIGASVQSNYEFGISRIIKSLEPYNKKLEARIRGLCC